MIDMHWERVEMITNENGRLAKEQPELDLTSPHKC
jgi:hypothetical protein